MQFSHIKCLPALLAVAIIGVAVDWREARAETIVLGAMKDNTMFEESPFGDLSNGAGDFLFTGRINPQGGEFLRRALLAFDVEGSVPSGAAIESVELTLHMSKSNIAGPEPAELHRATSDWGEGTSDALAQEGKGADATPGDATWIHTFFDTDLWSTPGGDFEPAASATIIVGGLGDYTWGSTSPMVADVQGWLDSPATNFGWILIGNENAPGTAKRFDSREHFVSGVQPRLTIDYSIAEPIPGDATGDGVVNGADLITLALNYGATSGVDFKDGDFDDDGLVGLNDLALLQNNFNPLSVVASIAAVPEPSTALLAVIGLIGLLVSSRRVRRL